MARTRSTKGTDGGTIPPSWVAYYRVSTDQQGRSGLGLEAQRAAVAKHVALTGPIVAEFQEIESGSRDDRPQLALALAACRAHHAILIIARLDRLTRNTAFLLSVVHGTGEGGVYFCDLPEMPPGPSGKFVLTLFAAVAELERGLISQRTKAALAAAKARGVKLGSPRLSIGFDCAASALGRQAQTDRARRRAADVAPYITAARAAGASSRPQIAAALMARGIRPPSGGDRWYPSQVRRIEGLS